MNYSKDTFCAYPFTYISTTNSGEYRACCESLGIGLSALETSGKEAWNSDFYKQLRLDLINGRKNSHCSTCWKNEAQRAGSSRQKELYNYSEQDVQDLISHTSSDGTFNRKPKSFEFKVGNLCNLKCIMCTQMESSGHETEIKEMQSNGDTLPSLLSYIENNVKDKNQVYRYSKNEQDELIKTLEYFSDSVKDFLIVGGEPLKNPLTGKILDILIASGYAQNINIIIISNLYDIDYRLIEKCKEFKAFYLNVSIDHVDDKKFHFIRYPSNYAHVKENLFKILGSSDINLSISFTLNIFNSCDLEEIIKEFYNWFLIDNKNLKIEFNHVTFPTYFSVVYLENRIKEQIIQDIGRILNNEDYDSFFKVNRLCKKQFQSIIEYLMIEPLNKEKVLSEQKRVLRLYDRYRNTDYKQIFPYLA